MPRFWVSIHHADDYDPSGEGPEVARDIDDLNDAMVAAGVRVFVGGLHHARTATKVVAQPGGDLVVSPGSYLSTSEHVGGFWVLEVADHAQAVEWGQRAARACRAPVEVRQFH
jgi:hypothetical protein